MGKFSDHSSAFIFDWIFLVLAGKEEIHESLVCLNFGQIQQLNTELVAIECLKNR